VVRSYQDGRLILEAEFHTPDGVVGDLVDRYSTSDAASDVDGPSGREGSFLACSFWYVEALALALSEVNAMERAGINLR
jgi:hypothetical protein